jgi:hypothetical protein
MAQATNNRAGNVKADPKKIRAQMAKTRAALTRELGALKGRVFGIPADKGEKIMPSKTKAARARKAKKTRGPSKAREVLEHVLTGAALGAVKGAAEVIVPEILPEKNKANREKSNKS